MRYPKFTYLILPLLSACVGLLPGDGYFVVTGTLPSSQMSCEALLLPESSSDQPFDSRRVVGSFSVGFVVSPKAAVYRVAISCEGTVRHIFVVHYGTKIWAGEKINIGHISL